ncbi:hypothetical protein Q0F99_00220 [Rathayibacter oskolensis]|nr:hypothetical protein [Rathayibacter oskolensis]WKK71696.1 hypothetical protein Q0F99_00220 [Rathayibacter oskolensis]
MTADLESQGFAVVCYDPSGADDLESVLTRSVASLADLSRRAADKQRDVWAEHSWGRRVETILDSVRVP